MTIQFDRTGRRVEQTTGTRARRAPQDRPFRPVITDMRLLRYVAHP